MSDRENQKIRLPSKRPRDLIAKDLWENGLYGHRREESDVKYKRSRSKKAFKDLVIQELDTRLF